MANLSWKARKSQVINRIAENPRYFDTYVIPLDSDCLARHHVLCRGNVFPIDKHDPHEIGGNSEWQSIEEFLLHHGHNVTELAQQTGQHYKRTSMN